MVRARTYCLNCSDFVEAEPNGECKRFHWLISVKLAKAQKVCSYDMHKDADNQK
jgi:hypothetical protein